MRIGFVAFDGMTALDLVGVYDPVTRLGSMGFVRQLQWEVCALRAEVKDRTGLRLVTRPVPDLARFDVLIVPGGWATRELMHDETFLSWMRTAAPVPLKTAVCTGSLLLGAADFLRDRSATTHRAAFELLRPFCRQVVDRRIVDEGPIVTARGVTSAIDLGLHLCRRLAGVEAERRIAEQIDYPSAGAPTAASS